MAPCWPKVTEGMTYDSCDRCSGLMDANEAVRWSPEYAQGRSQEVKGSSSEKLYRIGDETYVNQGDRRNHNEIQWTTKEHR